MPKIAHVESISMDFPVENTSLLHIPYYREISVLAFEQRSLIKYSLRYGNVVRQNNVRGKQATAIFCWYEIDGSIGFINLRSVQIFEIVKKNNNLISKIWRNDLVSETECYILSFKKQECHAFRRVFSVESLKIKLVVSK